MQIERPTNSKDVANGVQNKNINSSRNLSALPHGDPSNRDPYTNEMNRLAHGARFFQFHLVHPVSEILLGKAATVGRVFSYLCKIP